MEMQRQWGTSAEGLQGAIQFDEKDWGYETEFDINNNRQWLLGATTTTVTRGRDEIIRRNETRVQHERMIKSRNEFTKKEENILSTDRNDVDGGGT